MNKNKFIYKNLILKILNKELIPFQFAILSILGFPFSSFPSLYLFIIHRNCISNTMRLSNLWGRRIITIPIFLILFISTTQPVLSYVVVFREDFSDPELTGWELSTAEWCRMSNGTLEVMGIPGTGFEVINDELVSTNSNQPNEFPCADESMFRLNLAKHDNSIEYGVWGFNYYPGTAESWFIWLIDDLDQSQKYSREYNHTGIIIIDSSGGLFFDYHIGEQSVNYEDDKAFQTNSTGDHYTRGKWYSVELIRNVDGYYLFIDDQLRFSQPLGENYNFDHNFFVIGGFYDSFARFDNFTIAESDGNENSEGADRSIGSSYWWVDHWDL